MFQMDLSDAAWLEARLAHVQDVVRSTLPTRSGAFPIDAPPSGAGPLRPVPVGYATSAARARFRHSDYALVLSANVTRNDPTDTFGR